jgi:hypothetical protein
MANTGHNSSRRRHDDEHWIELVHQHVSSLRFGVVQIVVHDSRVLQIERTEKLRLDRPESGVSSQNGSVRGAVAEDVHRSATRLRETD